MNDFLDKVWFDNPIRDYFWVLGVILFVLLLNRIISKYLAGLVFRIVHRFWKSVDRKAFINLLVQPLGLFLVILVSLIALNRLTFPADLDIDIYRFTVKQLLHGLSTLVLIIAFIWVLLRVIDFISMILEIKANLTPDQTDNQIIVFLRDFFKIIVLIIGVILILKYVFGVNVGSLVTGLSIFGAAVALAFRESLENMIASFIIFFDKPFTVGDLVKVRDVTGTVERVGLRSTRLRSDAKTYVSVPNKQMVDSIIDNLSLRTQRKGEFRLELEIQSPTARLQQLVDAVRELVKRDEIETGSVFLTEISTNGYVITGEYFTAPVTMDEFNQLRQTIHLQILSVMEEMKLRLAGPVPK
jgi:MscS family membrane protein